jgi:hypothetical protein
MRPRLADRLVRELRKRPVTTLRRRNRQRVARRVLPLLRAQPILFVHIGKTAGTSFQRLLDGLDAESARRLGVRRAPVKLFHLEVPDLLADPGLARAELTFVFREPVARYASGFLERLHQGRPTTWPPRRLWSPGEAAAFQWFATPNDLFEALSSSDERVLSAALFAMDAIYQVRRDHVSYLGDAATFRRERGRYRFFCPIDALSTHVDRFFDLEPDADPQALRDLLPHARAGTGPAPELSELAVTNLRALRPQEFELHELLVEEWERLR